MRNFLKQNFWSHGTPLGYVGSLSQKGPPEIFSKWVLFNLSNPLRHPAPLVDPLLTKNLDTAGPWCGRWRRTHTSIRPSRCAAGKNCSNSVLFQVNEEANFIVCGCQDKTLPARMPLDSVFVTDDELCMYHVKEIGDDHDWQNFFLLWSTYLTNAQVIFMIAGFFARWQHNNIYKWKCEKLESFRLQ